MNAPMKKAASPAYGLKAVVLVDEARVMPAADKAALAAVVNVAGLKLS